MTTKKEPVFSARESSFFTNPFPVIKNESCFPDKLINRLGRACPKSSFRETVQFQTSPFFIFFVLFILLQLACGEKLLAGATGRARALIGRFETRPLSGPGQATFTLFLAHLSYSPEKKTSHSRNKNCRLSVFK